MVAVGFFLLLLIGIVLFGSGLAGPAPLIAALLCRLANGAEVDLMGFFVSRYFGLKAYGRIMGTMFGIFTASSGIGPYISTKSFDLYHSYAPAFRLYEGLTIIAMIIFALLAPYRFPARDRPIAGLSEEQTPARSRLGTECRHSVARPLPVPGAKHGRPTRTPVSDPRE